MHWFLIQLDNFKYYQFRIVFSMLGCYNLFPFENLFPFLRWHYMITLFLYHCITTSHISIIFSHNKLCICLLYCFTLIFLVFPDFEFYFKPHVVDGFIDSYGITTS